MGRDCLLVVWREIGISSAVKVWGLKCDSSVGVVWHEIGISSA